MSPVKFFEGSFVFNKNAIKNIFVTKKKPHIRLIYDPSLMIYVAGTNMFNVEMQTKIFLVLAVNTCGVPLFTSHKQSRVRGLIGRPTCSFFRGFLKFFLTHLNPDFKE